MSGRNTFFYTLHCKEKMSSSKHFLYQILRISNAEIEN